MTANKGGRNQRSERVIALTLPNGKEVTYRSNHSPVTSQNGSTITFAYELDEDRVFTVAINTEQIATLEIITPKSDEKQEILDLIEEAKREDEASEETC